MVDRSLRRRDLGESSFVLKAVGIPHAVLREGGEHLLVVPAAEALRAERELDAYARENQPDQAPPRSSELIASRDLSSLAVYATLLICLHLAQRGAWGEALTEAGRTDATLVRDGAWWRCVTALTLHADASHLAGNLAFGGLFGLFVTQLQGPGLGWLLITLGGALGNLANAWIQLPSHRSLGASTALFAALGLLVTAALRHGPGARLPGWRRWTPVVMGLALFGLVGVSDGTTDVMAHGTGIVAGFLLGWCVPAGRSSALVSSARVQRLAGAAVLALLALSWWLADPLATVG